MNKSTKINPEICKNCQYHWRFTVDDKGLLRLFTCIDKNLFDSFLMTYPTKVLLKYIDYEEFSKNKETFLHCYKSKSKIISNLHSEDIILKPEKITDELKKACKNIIVYDDECPFYIEHLITELNEK